MTETMGKTISVGQLRQNPTQMLREVRAGATYTITDHGEPVAEVAGSRRQTWIPASQVDALLKELGADVEWAREIAEGRAAEPVTDPWEGAE